MKVTYQKKYASRSFRYREKNDYTEHRLILDVYYDDEGDLIIDLKSRYRDGLGKKITRLNDVLISIPKENPKQGLHWQHLSGVSGKLLSGELLPKGGQENVIEIVHCGEFHKNR